MALVLCTGVDPALIETRKLILERAGHEVVTASDESSVTIACREHSFDVAVIGQAVSAKVKRQIMTLIRRHCPAAKVLELYRYNVGKTLENADSWLEVPSDVPQELAERVTALASKAKKKSN
jgi:CheY-like chemotaxis protein